MSRQEFEVHLLNANGLGKSLQIADAFSTLLDTLDLLVPEGRERSIVVTKLQEAAFFAKRSIANQPENQSEKTS